jgi:hypothetical protein
LEILQSEAGEANKMHEATARLQTLLDTVPGQLGKIMETESAVRHGAGKWSKKQILGHLIDSASNNHQRFVRAQMMPRLSFPGYAQEAWVKVQQYQNEPWMRLIETWKALNGHLLHVINHIPPDKWMNTCAIGENEPATLQFLVEDYVRHLEHHLGQILG